MIKDFVLVITKKKETNVWKKWDTGPRSREGQLAIPETIAEKPFEGAGVLLILNTNCTSGFIFTFIFSLNRYIVKLYSSIFKWKEGSIGNSRNNC